jgi:AraC-like DNA-binding protein
VQSLLFESHLFRAYGPDNLRYLRNLRLERAAELLRSGRSNVTEAALAVGYSSLSHFSKAFAEMSGVCPCVFPLNRRPVR